MVLFSKRLIILCVGICLLSSCTQKQLYNTVKQSNESRCLAKVGSEREQCFAELNKKEYQEYENERKSIVNDNSQ